MVRDWVPEENCCSVRPPKKALMATHRPDNSVCVGGRIQELRWVGELVNGSVAAPIPGPDREEV